MSTDRKMLAIVVPSIRPAAFVKWWDRWHNILQPRMTDRSVFLILVWDLPEVPKISWMLGPRGVLAPFQMENLCWKDIKPEWRTVVHTQSDSVRNLGFLRAAELGVDYIATLDDDTFPVDNLWIDRMLLNLQRWVDPVKFYPASFKTRGDSVSPFLRPVKLHHGLWEGVPDVYAVDQCGSQTLDGRSMEVKTVPRGSMLPVCGMNLAFHRDLLPAMYFWPQVPYRRYGDIWMGLIAKYVIDSCGFSMTSGSPSVFHTRLSNVQENAKHEVNGEKMNDWIWSWIYDNGIDELQTNIPRFVQALAKSMPKGIREGTTCRLFEWAKIIEGIDAKRMIE